MPLTKIKTNYGVVTGRTANGTVAVFKGIPFAKTPTGELRYKPPLPPEKWEGEIECLEYKPACVQPLIKPHNAKNPPEPFPMSEDCLYLNIWTPAENADDELPVMLWLYGGGFTTGRSSSAELDGAALASNGVILVTCAYRCGPLGFLALPEFASSETGTYGNAGIFDQIAALRWVYENIGHFGGDADRITVFGQSAGGISARLLLCSPLTKGLIRRVIVHSGGGLNEADPVRPKEELADITRAALAELGWTVEDLRVRDAADITNSMVGAVKRVVPKNELFVFQPCIDGCSITDVPGILIKRGEFPRDTDIICGTVAGDSWMFSRKIRGRFLNDGETLRAFAYSPSVSWGRMQAKNNYPSIYTYFFERTLPGDETPAPHSSEIAYVFGNLATDAERAWEKIDYELSAAMMKYWTHFAKTGDPNGGSLPVWTKFTASSPLSMNFRSDGFGMRNLADNESAERVIAFTVQNPGMLEETSGFGG